MADIHLVIERAVRTALHAMSIVNVEITFSRDHNDEEAWFVVIDVPEGTQRIGGEKLLSAMASVNDALLAIGETRFAYVHIRYLGDEDADEDEPARASNP